MWEHHIKCNKFTGHLCRVEERLSTDRLTTVPLWPGIQLQYPARARLLALISSTVFGLSKLVE